MTDSSISSANGVKSFALCADDYGFHPSVNEAIIELAQLRRISGTSCMMFDDFKAIDAQQLLQCNQMIDIGIHLNLTEFKGDNVSPIKLILNCASSVKYRHHVKQQIRKQIQLFTDQFGKIPDYIDSHLHVHSYPVVRHLVLDAIAEEMSLSIFIRALTLKNNINDGLIKTQILKILSLGSVRLQLKKGAHSNRYFGGAYNFKNTPEYAERFSGWAKNLPNGALLMCHPGNEAVADLEISNARFAEYQFLKSERYMDILDANHIQLIKPSEWPAVL